MTGSTHILRRLDRALALWTLLLAGVLFGLFANHGFDDPYITFRYAANLAAGAGFVYNPGLRVLSTTAPLHGLILASFAMVGLPLPLVSIAIGALSHALGGLALYVLGRLWGTPVAGVVAALLYPTFPLLISSLGGEAALAIALVLWSFVAAAVGRWYWSAILLAAAVVTRADALVAVACLSVYALLNGNPSPTLRVQPSAFSLQPCARLPWRAVLLGAMLCAPWFLFAWWYYGAPTPVTLAVKQSQNLLEGSRTFASGLSSFASGLWTHPLYRLLLILAAIGAGSTLLRYRQWLLVLGWSTAYSLAYSALGVTAYFWYYAPLVPGLVAAAGLGVQAVYNALVGMRFAGRDPQNKSSEAQDEAQQPVSLLSAVFGLSSQHLAFSVASLLTALLLGAQLWSLGELHALRDNRLEIYRDAGEWLAHNTAPAATVGAIEVGIIGYYAERPIIDFAGLIQPDIAAQLDPQNGYVGAARWAIEHYQPDYLVLPDHSLPLAVVAPEKTVHCREVAAFTAEHYPAPLRIYACLW
jgi:MFS family permease